MSRYIATKSIERYTKFKEGDEIVGVPENQCVVLEKLGHARRADESRQDVFAEQRPRRGRPTNAERDARRAVETQQAVEPREPQSVGTMTTRDYPLRDE
jgi:hypothetical protein